MHTRRGHARFLNGTKAQPCSPQASQINRSIVDHHQPLYIKICIHIRWTDKDGRMGEKRYKKKGNAESTVFYSRMFFIFLPASLTQPGQFSCDVATRTRIRFKSYPVREQNAFRIVVLFDGRTQEASTLADSRTRVACVSCVSVYVPLSTRRSR
jgi:hypothetical protein